MRLQRHQPRRGLSDQLVEGQCGRDKIRELEDKQDSDRFGIDNPVIEMVGSGI